MGYKYIGLLIYNLLVEVLFLFINLYVFVIKEIVLKF